MKKLISIFALTACLVLANVIPASARIVKDWSTSELWEKADLVVIATAESNQDALQYERVPKADALIPILTKFNVQAVLKGNTGKPTTSKQTFVTVMHDRYFDKAHAASLNGPQLVEFNPAAQNHYLIFLAKQTFGYYTPLTGQLDPYLSFLRLESYDLSKEHDK